MTDAHRAIALTSLLLIVAVALVGSPTLAATDYSLEISPGVDTPTRDVTFEGDSYTISAIGSVAPGGSITVDVSAPDGEFYYVELRDGDGRTVVTEGRTGDGEVTFDMEFADGEEYEPGTYVVTIDHNGIQAVHPLVVRGYAVSVDAPDDGDPGETVTVDAEVDPLPDTKPIAQVQVVVGNDTVHHREPLSEVADSRYSGTFSTDSLPEGNYWLYVVVRGSDTVLDRREVLSTSGSQSFTIGSSGGGSGGGGSAGGGSGSGGSGGGSGGAGPTEESPSPTGTASTTAGGPTTDSTTSSPAGTTDTATTTTDDPVITPNDPTPTATSTTTPGQPLGVLPALVALLAAAVLALRRQ